MDKIWLNEMTWEDVASYLSRCDVALIPIGSTEQHGPAGPLGLDSYVAIALCEDAATRTSVICTPPIWFGDSTHHLAFPGTISIRTEVLAEFVKDVIRSLAKHGFRKVIVVNGHKVTNLTALTSAVRNLKEFELPNTFLAVVDPIKIGVEVANRLKVSKEHHAGELEISHMLYKYPHLVKPDRIPKFEPNFTELYSKFQKSDLFAGGDSIDIPWSSKEQKGFTPTGVMSDASKASAEKGREYHQRMVNSLVEFIEWLKAR